MEQKNQVPEYQKLMEQAPQIHASGLEGDYRRLAEFNNVVLAGHQTRSVWVPFCANSVERRA